MREIRAERGSGKSLGRYGLLLRIDAIAIGVLRTDHHRASRPHRHNLVVLDGGIDAEHVDVVAEGLIVVICIIARDGAFVVKHRLALIGPLRQMTAKTTRIPR